MEKISEYPLKLEVTAAVLKKNGEYLVCTRPPGKAEYENLWEFPGGKIKSGESRASCIEREIQEELGLEIIALDTIMTNVHQYPEKTVILHFIRCISRKEDALPEPTEGQKYKYIKANDFDSVSFLPADIAAADFIKKIEMTQ